MKCCNLVKVGDSFIHHPNCKGKGTTLIELLVVGAALAVLLLIGLSLLSCNSNTLARYAGGKQTIYLDGEKLLNVTWKDDSLWLLTRVRASEELPMDYSFQERSLLGLADGKVEIIER